MPANRAACWSVLAKTERQQSDTAMTDKAEVIKTVCEALSAGTAGAAALAQAKYPFTPPPAGTRKFTEAQALRIFVRDGFIDRYSGMLLLFPPVLRILSHALPREFPYPLRATAALSPTLQHFRASAAASAPSVGFSLSDRFIS